MTFVFRNWPCYMLQEVCSYLRVHYYEKKSSLLYEKLYMSPLSNKSENDRKNN